MYEVKTTEFFDKWFDKIRDWKAIKKIRIAIEQMSRGHFGDRKPLGNNSGIFERRLDFGPGYRLYYCLDGDACVILLIGGTKKTQQRDIKKAIQIKRRYDYENSLG